MPRNDSSGQKISIVGSEGVAAASSAEVQQRHPLHSLLLCKPSTARLVAPRFTTRC